MDKLKLRAALVLAGALVGATLVAPASAHVNTSVFHLWTKHIKPKVLYLFYTKSQTYSRAQTYSRSQSDSLFARKTLLSGTGTINTATNPLDWTMLKGVPAGLADGSDAITTNADLLTSGTLAAGLLPVNGYAGTYYTTGDADTQFRKKYSKVYVVAQSGGDYTDPAAAVSAAAASASASDPSLVYMAPGTYDLGASPLTMKNWVDVRGAGANMTTLRSQVNSLASGTVVMTNDAVIADVAIQNNGTGFYSLAAYASGTNSTSRIENARALASGGSVYSEGVRASSSTMVIWNVSATASGGAATGIGIDLAGGAPTVLNSTVSATGSPAYGFLAQGTTNATIRNSSGTGGTYGLYNLNTSRSTLYSSVMSGDAYSIYDSDSTAGSVMMSGGGIYNAVNNTDGRIACSGVMEVVSRTFAGAACD